MLSGSSRVMQRGWLYDRACERGLTLDDLATLAGLHPSTLSTVNAGRPHTLRTWVALMEALAAHPVRFDLDDLQRLAS